MYHFTESGLDNVYLRNGFKRIKTADGNGTSIQGLEKLLNTIADAIVHKSARITGQELRYLRIALDLSQKSLGELMGKTDQMVAKWEKGESEIPILAEKAIRDLYAESIGQYPIKGLLQELNKSGSQQPAPRIEFEITSKGWRLNPKPRQKAQEAHRPANRPYLHS